MAINLLQKQIDKIVDYLAKEGDKIIKKASTTKQTHNRASNQMDAYGWCVFYNGKEEKRGFLTEERTASKPHNKWENEARYADYGNTYGRDDVENYFNEYKPQSNGFILVCVNAVFYTSIQEAPNTSRGQVKYRIISQIVSDMDDFAKQFKGARTYTTW